jgi:iron complex outermembrane receptor protein
LVDLEATAYWYRVSDFIIRMPIGTTQPPLARMVVFGYRNTDAELHGGEIGATWKLVPGWTAPLTFAVADGRNEKTGAGLAEIPPWEITAALRGERTWWQRRVAIELGSRVVGARTNPTPEENPLYSHTGGFAVWHSRAGAAITSNVRIEVGVENVLNQHYAEYLNPPVAPIRPASGDLLPGQQVPAPGRSWWVSVSKRW